MQSLSPHRTAITNNNQENIHPNIDKAIPSPKKIPVVVPLQSPTATMQALQNRQITIQSTQLPTLEQKLQERQEAFFETLWSALGGNRHKIEIEETDETCKLLFVDYVATLKAIAKRTNAIFIWSNERVMTRTREAKMLKESLSRCIGSGSIGANKEVEKKCIDNAYAALGIGMCKALQVDLLPKGSQRAVVATMITDSGRLDDMLQSLTHAVNRRKFQAEAWKE